MMTAFEKMRLLDKIEEEAREKIHDRARRLQLNLPEEEKLRLVRLYKNHEIYRLELYDKEYPPSPEREESLRQMMKSAEEEIDLVFDRLCFNQKKPAIYPPQPGNQWDNITEGNQCPE